MNDVAVPETLVYECLRSSPTIFDKKKQIEKKTTIYKNLVFFYQKMVGEDLRHA